MEMTKPKEWVPSMEKPKEWVSSLELPTVLMVTLSIITIVFSIIISRTSNSPQYPKHMFEGTRGIL